MIMQHVDGTETRDAICRASVQLYIVPPHNQQHSFGHTNEKWSYNLSGIRNYTMAIHGPESMEVSN